MTLIADLMTYRVVSLASTDRLDLAVDLLRVHRIRHLCVIDGDDLVGVVSDRDIHAALPSPLGSGAAARYASTLETVTVRQVMRTCPLTIEEGATARAGLKLLLEERLGCLPVIHRGRVTGIVTRADFLSVLAELWGKEEGVTKPDLYALG